MGYYATCDVKGCDEIAQIGAFGRRPDNWYIIHFEVDAKERDEAIAEAREKGLLPPEDEGAQLGPPGYYPPGEIKISRTVMMCDKHEMPEFDPEPPGNVAMGPPIFGALGGGGGLGDA